jgi:hypothetical protein
MFSIEIKESSLSDVYTKTNATLKFFLIIYSFKKGNNFFKKSTIKLLLQYEIFILAISKQVQYLDP